MNVRRPPCRSPRYLCPQFLDRRVECVCHGVRIDHLVREQVFVEPLSHVGAIGVAHRPVRFSLVEVPSRLRAHSPHRRDYALEAGMEHRRRDMNDLIWLLRVALGCLARRQIREPRLVEVQTHEPGNGELSVAEVEAAV
jgi:hypothetical protein